MDRSTLTRIKKLEQDIGKKEFKAYWCDQVPDDVDPDDSHTLVLCWEGEETRVTVVHE